MSASLTDDPDLPLDHEEPELKAKVLKAMNFYSTEKEKKLRVHDSGEPKEEQKASWRIALAEEAQYDEMMGSAFLYGTNNVSHTFTRHMNIEDWK